MFRMKFIVIKCLAYDTIINYYANVTLEKTILQVIVLVNSVLTMCRC